MKLITLINAVFVTVKDMSYRKPFHFAYNRTPQTAFYQSRAPLDILGGFQNFLIRTTNYVINTATPQVISNATQALDVYVQRFNESVAQAIANVNALTSSKTAPPRRSRR
jgi:hypothetical protein